MAHACVSGFWTWPQPQWSGSHLVLVAHCGQCVAGQRARVDTSDKCRRTAWTRAWSRLCTCSGPSRRGCHSEPLLAVGQTHAPADVLAAPPRMSNQRVLHGLLLGNWGPDSSIVRVAHLVQALPGARYQCVADDVAGHEQGEARVATPQQKLSGRTEVAQGQPQAEREAPMTRQKSTKHISPLSLLQPSLAALSAAQPC